MIRIVYIVSTLERCGPTNQLFYIIKYLDRNKFEPHIITLSPELRNSNWAEFESMGVYMYSLNLSRFKGVLYAKKSLRHLFAKISPNLIHTHLFRADILSSKFKYDYNNIATVRNFPEQDYTSAYGRIIGRIMYMRHIRALKKTVLSVGVSDAVSDNLKNKNKVSDVITIKNGVDTEIYFPPSNSDKKYLREKLKLSVFGNIFISSGTLIVRKDPFFLINAWRKIFALKNDYHLVFIGAGDLYEKCIRATYSCENIHVIGYVDNVIDYLKCGDYYVSASHSEGMPNAVLEAMACGLPVLLSNIDPHKEILACNPGAGFCYELGNEDSFCMYLDKLRDENRNIMAETSTKIIAKYFSAQKMSKMYQREYEKIC